MSVKHHAAQGHPESRSKSQDDHILPNEYPYQNMNTVPYKDQKLQTMLELENRCTEPKTKN